MQREPLFWETVFGALNEGLQGHFGSKLRLRNDVMRWTRNHRAERSLVRGRLRLPLDQRHDLVQSLDIWFDTVCSPKCCMDSMDMIQNAIITPINNDLENLKSEMLNRNRGDERKAVVNIMIDRVRAMINNPEAYLLEDICVLTDVQGSVLSQESVSDSDTESEVEAEPAQDKRPLRQPNSL